MGLVVNLGFAVLEVANLDYLLFLERLGVQVVGCCEAFIEKASASVVGVLNAKGPPAGGLGGRA